MSTLHAFLLLLAAILIFGGILWAVRSRKPRDSRSRYPYPPGGGGSGQPGGEDDLEPKRRH